MAIADIRNIEVCFSPQLAGFIATNDEAVVVVVDILRATTSMVSALANGARFIIPVSSLEKAKKMKAGGYTVAAERDGNILDFADFGNSAFEFMDGSIKDRQLVFSTTNGTVAVETARKFGTVVLGAFSNITALAHWIVEQKKNVIVLCSGWKNTFCLEDTIFAGALAEKLLQLRKYNINCDSAHAAIDLWQVAKNDPVGYVEKALHRERLRQLGADDVLEFSFQNDTCHVVPILVNDKLVDALKILDKNQHA
jgi:2-phosphosulfolactate phosphatase